MSWAGLFAAVNAIALVAWLALALLPRRQWVAPALRLGVVGSLAVLYAGLVVTALAGGFGSPSGPQPDFSTIAGVRAIFASDGGAVTGWVHYLAFDLLAGLWIADRCDARGIGRVIQLPILALTFLAGPAGYLLFLIISRGDAVRR
jgi:hypothetical protein